MNINMDIIKKVFPDAFRSKDVNSFIVTLVIYGVIAILSGIVFGLLAKLPIIGILFSLVGAVVGLYVLVGVILAILVFVKVIQD